MGRLGALPNAWRRCSPGGWRDGGVATVSSRRSAIGFRRRCEPACINESYANLLSQSTCSQSIGLDFIRSIHYWQVLTFPTNRGTCFSLNANPQGMKTLDSCTVRAQWRKLSPCRRVGTPRTSFYSLHGVGDCVSSFDLPYSLQSSYAANGPKFWAEPVGRAPDSSRELRDHAGINSPISSLERGFALLARSLHHYGTGHLRVDRTKVRIGSRFREGEGKLLVRVNYLGLERLRIIRADNSVRDIVAVGPGNRRSRRHRERHRCKTEIIDFHVGNYRRRSICRHIRRTVEQQSQRDHHQRHPAKNRHRSLDHHRILSKFCQNQYPAPRGIFRDLSQRGVNTRCRANSVRAARCGNRRVTAPLLALLRLAIPHSRAFYSLPINAACTFP